MSVLWYTECAWGLQMDEDKKSDIISALIYPAFIAALLIGFALSQIDYNL